MRVELLVTLDIDSQSIEEVESIIQEMDYSFSYIEKVQDHEFLKKEFITYTQINDYTIL